MVIFLCGTRGRWVSEGGSHSDESIQEEINKFPRAFTLRSGGYVPPVDEPRNLGAVVSFGAGSRAVFDGTVWVARWSDGSSSNISWDGIKSRNSIKVLSEGVKA